MRSEYAAGDLDHAGAYVMGTSNADKVIDESNLLVCTNIPSFLSPSLHVWIMNIIIRYIIFYFDPFDGAAKLVDK